MWSPAIFVISVAVSAAATELLDRNLVYRSPFHGHPQFARDTREIQRRHVEHAKRQTTNAADIADEGYPTYNGTDSSMSPYVWSSGVEFTHGVASGDPFHDSVILWTRAVPINGTAEDDVPTCVAFAIFDNHELSGSPLDSAKGFTTSDVDFTVKFEAKNLQPDSKYWYQFHDCTNTTTTSSIGATRTLPHPDTPADEVNGGKPLTLAVFSCAQYQNGYFNAYGIAAHNTSSDIYVHLGDYFYESVGNGSSIGREVIGPELATLDEYRQRLNQYRSDPQLLYAHQLAPWIVVWMITSKQFADNAWKGGSANSNDTAAGCQFSPTGVCYSDRKFASVRAYHEWMPIRQVDVDDRLRIWRNFQIGKLMDLTMLDTRIYGRDITDLYDNYNYIQSLSTLENRTLLGFNQETWLYDTLSESKNRGATWRIVGQQVVFAHMELLGMFNYDSWDGYRANRNRLLAHMYNNHIDNVAILSGDSHASWVSDLAYADGNVTYDPATGEGSLGVEFAGTAVTSPTPFGNITLEMAQTISKTVIYDRNNAELHWSDIYNRGFYTLTVSPTTLNATFWAMDNIKTPNLDAFTSAEFIVQSGSNKLNRPVAGGQVGAGILKPV